MPDPRDAVEFMRQVTDAESSIRTSAVEDMKFRYGDQWPNYAIQARGMERPQLVINETDGYCRQVINNIRQQRPRMSPHPTGAKGSIESAKIIKGVLRHIEVNSSADNAYDMAADHAVTIGWGYFLIANDFINEKSFDQDIYIRQIENPFSVYFDPNSTEPDGSDAEKALITTLMRKDAFERDYPGADVGGFTERGTGDQDPDWVTKDDIRVANYYCIERKADELLKLSDGTILFKSDLEIDLLPMLGVSVVANRPSFKRVVKQYRQTCFETLETFDLPFRWIPVIPVYGVRTMIDGKRDRMGLVRFAKDPQTMVNFWNTTITEHVAMAPLAKWLMLEGQDEGHENEWRAANKAAYPYLRFKAASVDGKEFVPQRVAPEPAPEGAVIGAQMASQHMQKVVGIFDPQMDRSQRDPKSGNAIRQERMQSDNSNFHFYDNLTRSLMHGGRVCLSAFPTIYDVQRVNRIIGDDGRPKLVTLNEKKLDPQTGEVTKVLNDVRDADEYDIVMETGPGYDTKRQEGVEGMMQLLGTPLGEQVAQVGGDLVVRMMDFPGAETLADRMAAANPFSKIDESEDVPPEQLKMQLAGAQMQLEKAQKVIQEQGMNLKYRMDVESMKDEGNTRRTLMQTTGKAHDTELRNQSMQHSVETKAISDQNKAEIDALVKLALAHIDTHHLLAEIDQRDKELYAKTNQDTTATT